MSRPSRWIVLLLSLSLLLAACAEEQPEEAADVGDEPAAEGEEPVDEGAEAAAGCDLPDVSGSVEVAAVWTGEEQRAFEEVLAAFSEETGVDVQYTSTGDDIAAVLGTRIEGGEPPDVAVLPQPGLMRDLVQQDALQPLDEIAGAQVDEAYAPVWRELGTVDGTLYGVWFKAANKSTFWYNVNVFDDAGVEPPETWDDLVTTAETLDAFGVAPLSIAGADGWTLTDWFENVYLRTAGPELYDQLANHEIPWTHESVTEALTILAELWAEDRWIAGDALQTDFPTSVTQVYSDPADAAMVYEGDFVAGVITGETDAELGTDADFFPFPAIADEPLSVVGAGDVAVLLTENEAAQALILYLACAESAEVWATQGGFTSPNQDVDLAVYPDDISRRSAEMLANAEVFRFDLSDLQPAAFGATVGQGLFQLFQDFLRDPTNVEGIAADMEDAAARAFE